MRKENTEGVDRFFGHLKPNGSSVLSFHSLNHIASVLVIFMSRAECSLKAYNTLNRLVTESKSQTNTVVSSAY